MARNRFWASAALALALCGGTIAATQAQESDLTVEQLVGLAPTIHSLKNPPRQILVEGWYAMKTYPVLSFRLLWRRDIGAELVMGDAFDGTPFLVCAEGRTLVYDAFRQRLIKMDGTEPKLRLWQKEDRLLGFDIGCTSAGPETDPRLPKGVVLDLASLFQTKDLTQTADKRGEDRYQLRSVSPLGSVVTAQVDPSRTCAFKRIELRSPDADGTRIILTRLELDGDPIPLSVSIPLREELAMAIPIERADLSENHDILKVADGILGSTILRVAAREPDIRAQMVCESPLKELEWDAIIQADVDFTAKLRQLWKSPIIDPPPIPASRRAPGTGDGQKP